ncbi:MAG TPA: 50S ribosomal protein L11 methyltransferase [Rhizomicrobium sp.]|jgi:ribosomal protein L11 methyltransferase|nr:50S ribosomal protein L11 methyltransferase [Rhizomicrobium sp.]
MIGITHLQTAPLWKAFVATTKGRAGDIAALFEITPPRPQAVLIGEEPFEDKATVEALYATVPDGELLSRLAGSPIRVELVPDQDWVKISQQGLPPVRTGRFFVHGAHDRGIIPPGVIPLRIEAGLAFGTGHHESTALCLSLLSDLARSRRFQNGLDLGCGTGVLAIAMAKLWKSRIVAADIDPVAVAVTRDNACLNRAGSLIRALTADGFAHPALRDAAPFQLIVANILAGPLTRLAPPIARALSPSGLVVISGLLRWQEKLVLSYYCAQRLKMRARRRDGNWSALLLESPTRAG